MSDYLVTDTELTYEADRIRAKTGGSSPILFAEGKGFGDAIDAIPTGTTPTGMINIISNGTYNVADKATAIVNVPGSTPTGTKQISITANGTTTEDVTNYASAEITVAVPQPSGNEMALLGSGSYTKTGTAQSMTIPVTYSGTPRFACIVVDAPISGSAQVISEAAYYTKSTDPQNVRTAAPTGAVYYSAQKADGSAIGGGLDPSGHMKLTASSLVASRANSTYVLQPNTYHWYIYGEAAT